MPRYLLGSDRATIVRQQDVMLTRLQVRYRPRFQRVLNAAAARMLRDYQATGVVPDNSEEDAAALAQVFQEMALASIRSSAQAVLDTGKSWAMQLERKDFADTFILFAADYIADEMIRARIRNITKTTRTTIIAAIARTVAQDNGVDRVGIARQISRSVPSINRNRADRISRTETHGASTYADQQATRQLGLDLSKEWVAVEDARTREDHSQADGQVVAFADPFLIGETGIPMMRPGDSIAPADQIVNCRCQSISIVND
jgi:uncharacterized protein with gpF-like domain